MSDRPVCELCRSLATVMSQGQLTHWFRHDDGPLAHFMATDGARIRLLSLREGSGNRDQLQNIEWRIDELAINHQVAWLSLGPGGFQIHSAPHGKIPDDLQG